MSDKFREFESYPMVVIIGGGFAGLNLAKKLAYKRFRVYVLDRNNYHTFQPLLYQVATGGLGSDAIAYPLRKIIGKLPNVAFRMANVTKIEPDKNKVITDVGDFNYDYLVIASGSNTNYFGNKTLEVQSLPLKSVPEALNIRSYILQEFEKALVNKDLSQKKRALNFVIVGGGPTGVELAGAMAEIRKNVIPKDYRELDAEHMTINLIEAGPRILAAMSEKSSKEAQEFLENLGVNILLNTAVTSYENDELSLSTGNKMETDTVIWSAGVKGQIINGFNEESLFKSRYLVNDFNQITGLNNVFAIGDVACIKSAEYPNGHPMVAPVAIQQADYLSKNLSKIAANKSMIPFKYFDKGSMATIGRNKAVVDLPFLHFKGWFAWYVWMFVHLMMLVGFRNRFMVFMNWAWNYITYERAIRLIIRPYKRQFPS